MQKIHSKSNDLPKFQTSFTIEICRLYVAHALRLTVQNKLAYTYIIN